MTEPIMSLRDVRMELGGKPVLQLPVLDLPAGGVTGLVGQNGSGKSSLLRILARQQAVSQGEVIFEGRRLEAWRERALAQRVAYLPQHLPTATGLNVRELVALGRYPWHGALGRFRPEDTRKIEEAMRRTQTDGLAERMVDALSGGERQRVWLAMLLAQDARLLLLDEPISALDPAHQVAVMSLIRQISREQALAVVVVLHDITLAARYCSHLIALKGGRLIAHGPAAEFMTAARLGEIYDTDMGVFPNPDGEGVVAYVRG